MSDYTKNLTPGTNSITPIRIKQEIVEHLDLFHRMALEELVSRGRAEILP